MCPHRLAVRTPPFHGGNRGSSPRGDAIFLHVLLPSKTALLTSVRLNSLFPRDFVSY